MFCGSHAEPGTVPDNKDTKARAPTMSNPGAVLIRSLGWGFSAQMLKERLLARTNKEDVPHRGALGDEWDPKGPLPVTALTQMLSMALSILECLGSDFMFVASANCSSAFFHSSFLACMKAILYSTWKSRGHVKLETTSKSGTKKDSHAHTGNAVWGHSSLPSIQGLANN